MVVVLVAVGVILVAVPFMIGISLSVNTMVALAILRRIVGIFIVVHLRIQPVLFPVTILEEAEVAVVLVEGLVLILWLPHPQILFQQHLLVQMIVGDCHSQRLNLFVVLLLNLILLLQLPPLLLYTGIPRSALSDSILSSQASWIIDSGASHHMNGMSTLFHTYQVSSGKDKVRIADDSYSLVVGHDDIHATSELSLSSVLYVPNFTLNLLSISHLTQHLNCFVTFFPSHCLFQDLEMKKTIDLRHENDRLYILDSSTPFASTVRKGNPLSSDELLYGIAYWDTHLFHCCIKFFLSILLVQFLIVNRVNCLNIVELFTQ